MLTFASRRRYRGVVHAAVIFDLDGTLIDSLEDIRSAVNDAFSANGLRIIAREEMPHLVGWGINGLVERALAPELSAGTLSKREAAVLAQDIAAAYSADPAVATRVYPGMAELLDTLESWGLATAILTNKPDQIVQRLVPQVFGTDRFDVVRGAVDGKPAKPQADALLSVLTELGVRAEQAVMIGDSEVDIQTARAAGVAVFGVSWGYRSEAELSESDAIAHDSKQLQHMLQTWREQHL